MEAVPLGQPVYWRGHWMRRTGVGDCPWEVIRHDGPSGPFHPSHMPIVRAQMQARGMGQSGDVSGGGFNIGGAGTDGGTSAGGAVDAGGGDAGSAAATGTSPASTSGGGGAPAPTTVTPTTTTPTNWAPWILGGATVVAVGAVAYAMYHRGRRIHVRHR